MRIIRTTSHDRRYSRKVIVDQSHITPAIEHGENTMLLATDVDGYNWSIQLDALESAKLFQLMKAHEQRWANVLDEYRRQMGIKAPSSPATNSPDGAA